MEIQVEGANIKCSFTRTLVFDTWISIKDSDSDADRCNRVLYSMTQLLSDVENFWIDELENRISYLCKKLCTYWKQVRRSHSRMVAKYGDWLHVNEVCRLTSAASHPYIQQPAAAVSDRPSTSGHQYRKDFEDCSERSKRRRIAELAKVDNSAIDSLLNDSNRSNTSSMEFNTDEVLSLITEAKLTKHQYLLLRRFINSKSQNALPSYHKVLEAKKRCYPSVEIVTESSAEIELQSLLDHTTTRILESQSDVLSNVDISKEFVLVGKWGFDGSTGHSEYKQKFSDSSIEDDDDSLFVTSYCPLQLICKSNTSDPDQIVWKNPRPSSTRYCRPIRFQFAKETKELSVKEESCFKNKIDNLQPSSFTFKGCEIKIQHSLQLTMVDGKVCGALSDLSCSMCYICSATPKEMNDIDKCLSKSVDNSK